MVEYDCFSEWSAFTGTDIINSTPFRDIRAVWICIQVSEVNVSFVYFEIYLSTMYNISYDQRFLRNR